MSGKWYVIQVFSGQEKKVQKAILENRGQHSMQELVEEILIPSEHVAEVKKGEQKITEKRLWPGYALVKMTLTDESWQYVRNTNGVIGFMGGGKPVPLTDQETDDILKELKVRQDKVVQKHRFDVGATVKIVDGVFVNFTGTVLEVHHDKGRLSVMVSIFGRDTRVDDLEFWQIEEVAADTEM